MGAMIGQHESLLKVSHYIDGNSYSCLDEPSLDLINPHTGEQLRRVSIGSDATVHAAVNSASKALPEWAATPAIERVKILFKFREFVNNAHEELVSLIVEEGGKSIDAAHRELARGLESIEFACGAPHLLKGEFSPNTRRGTDTYSLNQPLGTCIGITPFNFPVMVPLWMFPIAIMCGNTFVLKPSEHVPSAALRMAKLATAAGIPPGVLNVVQGDAHTAQALAAHQNVEAVSFVGSTSAATQIYETTRTLHKRTQALGGAKNHLIVLSDASLDAAIEGIIEAAFGSAGQRCMSVAVVVAVGSIADELVARLSSRIRDLPNDSVGPLITHEHLTRVREYIDIGVTEGATLIIDGRLEKEERTFFVAPTLFDNVQPGMRLYTDEIFGPVLAVVRVPTFEEALKLVNTNTYGNAAALFTGDPLVAQRFRAYARVGMIGINVAVPAPAAFYSFGGWKRSLFGDIAVNGQEGVRFYTRKKIITSRWLPRESES